MTIMLSPFNGSKPLSVLTAMILASVILTALLLVSTARYHQQASWHETAQTEDQSDHFDSLNAQFNSKREMLEGNLSRGAVVSLTLVSNTIEMCSEALRYNGVLVQLEYREMATSNCSSSWKHLHSLTLDSTSGIASKEFVTDPVALRSGRVQFRLRQLEHGGGRCGCWSVCQFMVRYQEEELNLR